LVVFLETVQASASSEESSTARIPVGCPPILIVETFVETTDDVNFSSLRKNKDKIKRK
jgi:hypothetical protein